MDNNKIDNSALVAMQPMRDAAVYFQKAALSFDGYIASRLSLAHLNTRQQEAMLSRLEEIRTETWRIYERSIELLTQLQCPELIGV